MNELVKIAEESGLPQTKSQALLEIFQEYFGIAAEWEEQAKSIKVTDESQTELMLKAREGRKFLQEARIKLEKTRVSQKKFALLEGKAIDGMANVLKASIVPVEQYLAEQENFVVNKKKAEALARQEQAMRDLEAKEAAEEQAEIEKLEKERIEALRRREEAEEGERKAKIARDKAIATQKKMEEIAREEREAHQKEIEQKQRENFEREEKIRVENERKIVAEKAVADEKLRKEIEQKQQESFYREEKIRVENERKQAAEQKIRDAENEERDRKRVVGQNRQSWLFKIGANLDFARCADMSTEVWDKFYEEKKEEYRVSLERLRLKKQRAEKEEERLNKERKLRNDCGRARQELLSKIDIHLDFQTCAGMKESVWVEFYEGKKKEYDSEQNRIFVEKLRVEREEKELAEERMESDRKMTEQLNKNRAEQAIILKARKEKASQVQCPKCSHVFIPPQKLL